MNTINSSTGYSSFQLRLGRSSRVIPPIVPTSLPDNLCSAGSTAENIINQLTNDIADTKDNLIQAKAIQAMYAKRSRHQEVMYQPGDKVMLSTFHRHRDFKQKDDDRVAKFFPRWYGPYTITKAHPETSSYTLDNNSPYPYYASKLKLYHQNDPIPWTAKAWPCFDTRWNARTWNWTNSWHATSWTWASVPRPMGWLRPRGRWMATRKDAERLQGPWLMDRIWWQQDSLWTVAFLRF